MNSTSLGERGGSLALVDDDSVRVAWPGAPGCTMTGNVTGSACCAKTGSDAKEVRIKAEMRLLRDNATLITERRLVLPWKGKE